MFSNENYIDKTQDTEPKRKITNFIKNVKELKEDTNSSVKLKLMNSKWIITRGMWKKIQA